MNEPNTIFDRKLLIRRRVRASAKFESHDFLLKRIADDFSERLETLLRTFPMAVNLGAHHGLVSMMLAQHKNVGSVISTENCLPLLMQCIPPRILCDEEYLPFADQSLNLVVSGLSLQFINDLPGTLIQIRRALKPDGLFLGAVLGGETLFELRQSFLLAEEEMDGGASPRISPSADIRDYGALLQRAGFALPVTDTDNVTVTYETPLHLMRDLRGMGCGNVLQARKKTPLKQSTLLKVVEIYKHHFSQADGRIPATFEIITLTGWAPHENQQKPLRPGTAQQRLADVLGTEEKSTGEKAG